MAPIPDGSQAVTTDLFRPPLETYVRTSRISTGYLTVEPGIEFRDGDDFKIVSKKLRSILVENDTGVGDARAAAELVAKAIVGEWPDRAYFIEVHGIDGAWLQIFQPYGIPRNT